jgi:hypothetical protein
MEGTKIGVFIANIESPVHLPSNFSNKCALHVRKPATTTHDILHRKQCHAFSPIRRRNYFYVYFPLTVLPVVTYPNTSSKA